MMDSWVRVISLKIHDDRASAMVLWPNSAVTQLRRLDAPYVFDSLDLYCFLAISLSQ